MLRIVACRRLLIVSKLFLHSVEHLLEHDGGHWDGNPIVFGTCHMTLAGSNRQEGRFALAGRYGSGALIVKDGPARWRVWDDHYWYAPDHWKDRKRVMYHRVLTPDKPSQTIQTPIPDPPVKSGNAPPAAPADLRAQRRGKSVIRLQWAPAAGADYYDVHRDGKRIGGSLYPRFADHDVEAGRSYKYEVWARDIAGQKSPTAVAGEVRARDD